VGCQYKQLCCRPETAVQLLWRSKFGFGRRKSGDLGPLLDIAYPEPALEAGTTQRFPTALHRCVPQDTCALAAEAAAGGGCLQRCALQLTAAAVEVTDAQQACGTRCADVLRESAACAALWLAAAAGPLFWGPLDHPASGAGG
jgi:hypothetical protein